MLKKLIIGAVVVNFVFMLLSVVSSIQPGMVNDAQAGNTTVTFIAGATVPQFLEMSGSLYQMLGNETEFSWDTPASSLDFGTLEDSGYGWLRGQYWYGAVLAAATSGRKYLIKMQGVALDDGHGGTIGKEGGAREDAYVVVPDYQGLDKIANVSQGNMPGDAYLEGPNRVDGTHNIYQSGIAGLTRLIRAYISIGGPDANGKIFNYRHGYDEGGAPSGDEQDYPKDKLIKGWQLAGKDTPSGSYTGGVMFTLTLD